MSAKYKSSRILQRKDHIIEINQSSAKKLNNKLCGKDGRKCVRMPETGKNAFFVYFLIFYVLIPGIPCIDLM